MTQSPDPDPIKKDDRHRLNKISNYPKISKIRKMSEKIRKTNFSENHRKKPEKREISTT